MPSSTPNPSPDRSVDALLRVVWNAATGKTEPDDGPNDPDYSVARSCIQSWLAARVPESSLECAKSVYRILFDVPDREIDPIIHDVAVVIRDFVDAEVKKAPWPPRWNAALTKAVADENEACTKLAIDNCRSDCGGCTKTIDAIRARSDGSETT